jgi:outer membrane receptor protein involved in Fe transport
MRYIFDATIDRYLHDTSRATNRWDFSELVDKVASAGITGTYTIPMENVRAIELTAGLDHLDNARTSTSRSYRFVASNLPLAVQQSRPDFLFADFNINPDRLVIRETTGSQGAGAYDAQIEVTSAFVKADFEPILFLRLALGGRFERGLQSVTPRSLFLGEAQPAQPPKRKEEYFLPAGTLTWNFFEDMQLRIGASQTIGRPQFRELAPQQYLDPDSDRLFIGNPFLVDTEIMNFDARYEFYFGEGQFFTLGGFFKDMDRPIESVVAEQGATIQQTYLNAPKANLYGAEIEVRKIFTDPFPDMFFLGGKDIFLQANYTWADSEVIVETGDVVFPLSSGGAPEPASNFIIDGTRLQGQSEHVANFQLGWEDPTGASQGTLIVTYVSERSSARGRPGEPDFLQEPGVIMDFVYRRELDLFGQELSLNFKAQNLLDEEYLEHQMFGGGEVIVNRYDLGRSYSVGLSTRF